VPRAAHVSLQGSNEVRKTIPLHLFDPSDRYSGSKREYIACLTGEQVFPAANRRGNELTRCVLTEASGMFFVS